MTRRLKIGAIRYTLKFLRRVLDDRGNELCGDVDFQRAVIRISTTHDPQTQQKSVWHEALHVMLNLHGVKATEAQVDGLADTIIQTLRDNPILRGTV